MKNNIFEYNKIIYHGNVNRAFFFHCLKKNIKLLKFLLYNFFCYLLSLIFKSKKDIYEKKKFKYLKEIKNIDKEVKEFYKKKKLNDYIEDNRDIIVDRIPNILIPNNLGKKIIAYELDENYEVKLDEYLKNVENLTKANKLYIRRKDNLLNINANKIFLVHNNRIKYLPKRKPTNENFIKFLVIIAVSFLLTLISFCFTNYLLDMKMIISYFEPLLFILNFLIVLLLVLFFSVLTKRIHISFLINSALIIILGIANQTKLMFRDDIVKFEDLTIIKEAFIMKERYGIVMRWYTIAIIIISIVIFFYLKRYVKKIKLNIKKHLLAITLTIVLITSSYATIYQNQEVYNSVGNTDLINIWITTRQYQIRGLLYPFVYTIKDAIDVKPDNYDAKKAKEILDKYTYEDLEDNKKVNIISIMLEAYNDFSKFGVIDFNEDIYAKFHEIEDKSISGSLVTTIFGGGTIVTERDFLTGYYNHPPYRKLTNSYPWYFKEQGYKVEAMHPAYGAFYNRASVDINLGFDKYYYCENTFCNEQEGFLNDNDFFDYIIEGYENSKKEGKPYFNFSVTYQNHGPYYSENYSEKEFFFDNKGYSEEGYNTINEYFSGIKKTNEALAKLIDYFEKEEEPTIVVFFGDHNPYLGENALAYNELGINLDLGTIEGFKNYYETPYVIYGNDAAKRIFNNDFVGEGENISPIFLMNELFDLMGEKGNKYLQYMNDLKSNIDVISNYYYKEDGKFVYKDDTAYKDLLDEYTNVNYYYSRNYEYKK